MLIFLTVKEQDVCEGAAAIWQRWDEHDRVRLYEVLTLLLTAEILRTDTHNRLDSIPVLRERPACFKFGSAEERKLGRDVFSVKTSEAMGGDSSWFL